MKYYLMVHFTEFPPISESVKAQEPFYWQGLDTKHSYKVVNDYEKVKENGKSEHFLLIVNLDGHFQEVPVRDNIKVNFIN